MNTLLETYYVYRYEFLLMGSFVLGMAFNHLVMVCGTKSVNKIKVG